jgi:hypothetical protein
MSGHGRFETSELEPTRHPSTDHMGNPGLAKIFVGANGIRAGWRLLMFVAIIVGLLYGKLRLYGMLHVHAPSPGDKVDFPGYGISGRWQLQATMKRIVRMGY